MSKSRRRKRASAPRWWHPHGARVTLQNSPDNITVVLKGGRPEERMVEVYVTRVAFNTSWITWVVWTACGMNVRGNSCALADEELRLAFGLRKPRSDVAGRCFRRKNNYLNIPSAGSAAETDLHASILITPPIRRAVALLFSNHTSEDEEEEQ